MVSTEKLLSNSGLGIQPRSVYIKENFTNGIVWSRCIGYENAKTRKVLETKCLSSLGWGVTNG